VIVAGASLAYLVWQIRSGALQRSGSFLASLTAEGLFAFLGAVASGVALVGFVPWALQQRRRPEVEFLWRLSTTGELGVADWPSDDVPLVPEVEAGTTIVVEASIKNVGDATALTTQTNFVVPECIAVRGLAEGAKPARFSHNVTAGVRPGNGVHFIVATFDVAPGNWHLQRFELTLPDTAPTEVVRVLLDVSQERFNATGRRRLPVLLIDGDAADVPAGEQWPPAESRVRWWECEAWHRPRAQPVGRVRSTRANRADVRDLRIVPRRPAGGATVA
jgi:hypothetical protein